MPSSEVVYSGDIFITDAKERATLCVFYDRVLLPAWENLPLEAVEEVVTRFSAIRPTAKGEVVARFLRESHAACQPFVRRDQLLFDVGVLGRLPWLPLNPFTEKHLSKIDCHIASFGIFEVGCMLGHFLRQDITSPQIFGCRSDSSNFREQLKAAQATGILAYLLPSLDALDTEQILAVREKVKDTREGFSMHLQRLSKQVEQALGDKQGPADVARAAQCVVETELIPDYREFRRQLAAERTGWWAHVLDGATKVLEVNAAPWTPKFYGALLEALGVSALTAAAESKERLSNRSQAFYFMKGLEDFDQRRVP
jgi:hypothetical protein